MSFLLLGIAFVLTGVITTLNKALIEMGLSGFSELYIISTYGTALLLACIGALWRPSKGKNGDQWLGMAMGACGVLGLVYILLALNQLSGIVAFPVRSLGNMVLTAVVSMLAWKERLSRHQWLGICLSLIAIWLLRP